MTEIDFVGDTPAFGKLEKQKVICIDVFISSHEIDFDHSCISGDIYQRIFEPGLLLRGVVSFCLPLADDLYPSRYR